ncbi:response regulator [candidate division FCPU426 bacterium]|nr:response regulator [candidate division FCPU426 bacterium]
MSNILVVDDEKSINESLSMILSNDGHAIDMAMDGLDALGYLTKKKYDLVLTDIRMPRMDGMELLKTIRHQWGAQTPVILISAYATEATVSQALEQGARDLIVKPFDIQTVREAVNYVLTQKTFPPIEELDKLQKNKIQHRQISQEQQRRILEYSVLDEIGKTVSAISGIEKVGSTIISMVQQILDADYALLVIYNHEGGGYKYRCAYKDGQVCWVEPSTVDEYVLEWINKNRRSLYIKDLSLDKEFVDCYASGSLLGIPFMRKTQTLGALVLYKEKVAEHFSSDALQFLSVMASMATAAIENTNMYNELKSYFNSSVKALISTIEAKDSFVWSHSSRVARYATMIAKHLKLSELEQRRLEYLSMLHDIGKIAVPEEILRQKAKLSEWEIQILRTHVVVGENIVRPINFLPEGGRIVRAHHERYDGKGYPDALKGDAIPVFSRIIHVANAFDMLTSDYPGCQKMEPHQAIEEMIREAGKAFDPDLLNIFLNGYRQRLLQ